MGPTQGSTDLARVANGEIEVDPPPDRSTGGDFGQVPSHKRSPRPRKPTLKTRRGPFSSHSWSPLRKVDVHACRVDQARDLPFTSHNRSPQAAPIDGHLNHLPLTPSAARCPGGSHKWSPRGRRFPLTRGREAPYPQNDQHPIAGHLRHVHRRKRSCMKSHKRSPSLAPIDVHLA